MTDLGEIALARGRHEEAVPLLERALAMRERYIDRSTKLAHTRFALARALEEADADRARARELALRARDAWREAGSPFAKELEEVEAWLEGHR